MNILETILNVRNDGNRDRSMIDDVVGSLGGCWAGLGRSDPAPFGLAYAGRDGSARDA